MRVLRGLRSRQWPCGCGVGWYELYDARVACVIDSRGEACTDPRHQPGEVVAVAKPWALEGLDELTSASSEPARPGTPATRHRTTIA